MVAGGLQNIIGHIFSVAMSSSMCLLFPLCPLMSLTCVMMAALAMIIAPWGPVGLSGCFLKFRLTVFLIDFILKI